MCYYDDDIAPKADLEDDLLTFLYNFHLICFIFIVKISVHKMKAMTINKEPIRWKLKIMEFNYLGVNIIISGNLVKEIET